MGYPYCIFALLGLTVDEFRIKWTQIVSTQEACSQCLDAEFSATLLRLVPTPASETLSDWLEAQSTVDAILNEVATCCPLNTEAVENKHAITQALFTKVRGQYKQLQSCVEDSFLDCIARSYEVLKKQLSQEELPLNLAPAVSRLGKRTRSAYSLPPGLFQPGESLPLDARLEAARTKKTRRVSGWSVFCREGTQSKQLNPADFSALIKDLGSRWKRLPAETRAAYQVQAEHENALKADLLQSPLPTKTGKHRSEAQSHAEQNKGFRKFLIRAKPKRSLLNQRMYTDSSGWSAHGLGIADAHSALKLDQFDTMSSQSHPADCLNAYVHSPLPSIPPCTEPAAIASHDQSCGVAHGQCIRCVRHPIVHLCQRRLVDHLVRSDIKIGSCVSICVIDQSSNSKSFEACVFIGVVYKKPAMVVLLELHGTDSPDVYNFLGSFAMPSMLVATKLLDSMVANLSADPSHIQVTTQRNTQLR
jgi:hypothetical protein